MWNVILHNEAIQRVTKVKFFGVIVDKHLNLKDHVSMVSQKNSKSYGISRIRNTLDIKSKKLIYYSLIHPYLNVSMSDPNFNTLVQLKRGQCVLFATAQQPHSRDIFINQKILPLDKLINQQEGILAYKVMNMAHIC